MWPSERTHTKAILSEATLTFDHAVEMSVTMETAIKDAAEPGRYRNGAAIHTVRVKSKRGQYSKPCFRCAQS